MAKDITIAEGGVGRNFGSTTKLKTDLMGGGTQYWVPEDEAGDYVTKRHLNVTQNGTYTPENGFYDEVTVSVAINEETYGIDPDTGTISTLVTDPDDGEKYIVSVEPDGTVTRTLFPTKMVITTPPNKTSYTEGETMNYTGIVVTLYDKAGNVFTDDVYTTGVIPFAELEFPVTVAPAGSGGGGDIGGINYSRIDVVVPATVYGSPGYRSSSATGTYSGYPCYFAMTVETAFFATRYNHVLYTAVIYGGNVGAYIMTDGPYGASCAGPQSASWTQTVSGNDVDTMFSNIPESTVEPTGTPSSSTASIPVLWTSPQPHFPVRAKFRETFEIEVTNNE